MMRTAWVSWDRNYRIARSPYRGGDPGVSCVGSSTTNGGRQTAACVPNDQETRLNHPLDEPRTSADGGGTERAVLGGGCFWCLEAVFVELDGVRGVRPGYAGGNSANPSYEEVCSGRSGHAEVIEIAFDPTRISFDDLLQVFFATHDPTTRDRQGNDVGPQYRSVIFCRSPAQRAAAVALVERLDRAGIWSAPIVTEVAGDAPFHPAEDYHRDYFARNPGAPYCAYVVSPKLTKFRRQFAAKLRRRDA